MAEQGKNSEAGLPSDPSSSFLAALLQLLGISKATHDATPILQRDIATFSHSLKAIREVGQLIVNFQVMQLSTFGISLIYLIPIIRSLPAHENESSDQVRMVAKDYLLRLCDFMQDGNKDLSSQIKDGWHYRQHLFHTIYECKWWNDYVHQPSHNLGSISQLTKLSNLHESIQMRYPKPEDRCLFYKEVFAKGQLTANETLKRANDLLVRVKWFDVRAAAVKLIESMTNKNADHLFDPIIDSSLKVDDPTQDGGWLRLSMSVENGYCLYFALCAIYGKTLDDLRSDLMSMFDLHFSWSEVRRLADLRSLRSRKQVKTYSAAEEEEVQTLRSSANYRVTQHALGLIQLTDKRSMAPVAKEGSKKPNPIPSEGAEEAEWKVNCRERFRQHVYCSDRFKKDTPEQENQFGGRGEALILAHHEDYAKTMLYAINYGHMRPQEEYGIVSNHTTEVAYLALSKQHYSLLVQWNAKNGSVQWKFPFLKPPHGIPENAVGAMGRTWSARHLVRVDDGIDLISDDEEEKVAVEEEEEKEHQSTMDTGPDSNEQDLFEEDAAVTGGIGHLEGAAAENGLPAFFENGSTDDSASLDDEQKGKEESDSDDEGEDSSSEDKEDESNQEEDKEQEEEVVPVPKRTRRVHQPQQKQQRNHEPGEQEEEDAQMDEPSLSSAMESDIDHAPFTSSAASSATSSRASSCARKRCERDDPQSVITKMLEENEKFSRKGNFDLPFTAPLTAPLPYVESVEKRVAKYGLAVITPHPRDLLVGELAEEAQRANTIHHPTVMNFGCGNNNGVESKRLSPSIKELYSKAPPAVALLSFIEQDWAMLEQGKSKPVPPAMRSRRYTKDVSQSTPWRNTRRGMKSVAPRKGAAASVAAVASLPSQPAAAAASSDAAPAASVGLSTLKQFFPKLDQKLWLMLNDFDKSEKQKEKEVDEDDENKSDEAKEAKDEEISLDDEDDENDEAKQEAELHHGRMQIMITWLEEMKKNEDAAAAAEGIMEKCSALIHPLLFNELRYHRRSLVLLAWVHFEGVMDSYLYIKVGFQFFNLHIEQMIFSFIHYQLTGESLWFIIPSKELPKLHKLATDMYRALYGVSASSHKESKEFEEDCEIMGRVVLYSKQLFPPLSLLKKHDIQFRTVRLRANETIVADGDCAHFGFSTAAAMTISVAANNATDRWLKRGLAFLIDHFKWVSKLRALFEKNETIWKEKKLSEDKASQPDSRNLLDPKTMVSKALNLCPTNFTCSFMHGLRMDLLLLAEGKKTLCVYPLLQNKKLLAQKYANQCQEVLQLMHAEAKWMKTMDLDLANCKVCLKLADESDEGHTCMQCLCTMPAT